VAYTEILNCVNKALIVDLSRYLDKSFMNIIHILWRRGYYHDSPVL
jgi:hypothetical protein